QRRTGCTSTLTSVTRRDVACWRAICCARTAIAWHAGSSGGRRPIATGPTESAQLVTGWRGYDAGGQYHAATIISIGGTRRIPGHAVLSVKCCVLGGGVVSEI